MLGYKVCSPTIYSVFNWTKYLDLISSVYCMYLDLIHRLVLVKGESVQIQQIPEMDLAN